jgi:3-hydroxyisobutyrate dehydrogenase-like beta-hydroxyacid dehydrogenase
MLKDLSAVAVLAHAHHEQLPVSMAALEVYRAAEQRGLSRRDLAALIELYPAAPR